MKARRIHKTRWASSVIAFLVIAIIGGCSKGCSNGDESKSSNPNPTTRHDSASHTRRAAQPVAGEYRVVEVPDGARLRGVVRYSGTPPQRVPLVVDHDRETCAHHTILSEDLIVSMDGKVQNVVVWLQGVAEGKAWSDAEVVLDQEGCVYRPHVVVVGAGRPLKFANSDPILHNVNTFPRENPPLNVSLLAKGMGRPVTRTLKFADEIKVTCDAHKWMTAWIIVRDNPYFAVTGPDGGYSIGDIPPGTYTMVVWHESLGKVERTVQLTAGETRSEDVEMKAR